MKCELAEALKRSNLTLIGNLKLIIILKLYSDEEISHSEERRQKINDQQRDFQIFKNYEADEIQNQKCNV